MNRTDYFERGMELYKSKRYKEAAEHFLLGIVKLHSANSKIWLANCYATGLGVEKNLLMAKDLYQVAYYNLAHSQRNSTIGAWLLNLISLCLHQMYYINKTRLIYCIYTQYMSLIKQEHYILPFLTI